MDENIQRSLDAIERGVNESREATKSVEERQEKIAAESAAIHTTIQKHDERLESAEGTLQKLEAAVEKTRFGTGRQLSETDVIRNAMPDYLARQIPALTATKGYQRLRAAHPDSAMSDPAIVALGLGWMGKRIAAVMANHKGNPALAGAFNNEAEEIAKTLNGLVPLVRVDMQEDTASEGGYLVPTVTEAVIGWLVKEASVVRQAGPTTITMTTKTHSLPTLANDFTVTWTDEEGTIADSVPATPFGSGTLTAKKQTGLVTVSNELLQDNIVNLMDFVMTHLTQQIGRAEDTQALEGATNPFDGLFTVSGTNAVAGGSDALSFAELVKLIYGGEYQSTMDNGVIFCHPFILRDALQLTTGATGTPWILVPTQQGARPRSLLGVPTFPTTTISRVRGTGTNETTAYHGDPRYIVIGDRAGTQFMVNPYGGNDNEFEKDQVKLRLTRRVGVLIWVPAYFTKLTAVTV